MFENDCCSLAQPRPAVLAVRSLPLPCTLMLGAGVEGCFPVWEGAELSIPATLVNHHSPETPSALQGHD
jgi:hypothetical protein